MSFKGGCEHPVFMDKTVLHAFIISNKFDSNLSSLKKWQFYSISNYI